MTEITANATTAAQAAAQWWADAISHPRYDNGGGDMAAVMMTLLASRTPDPRPAERASFADVLAPRIQAKLDLFADWDESDRFVAFGVDYGPDPILADAAREAGVSTQKFPWKTSMWVHNDHVTVSAGYGAGVKLVWATAEWHANRPHCGSQAWDESRDLRDYHGEPWQCSEPKYHDGPHRYDMPLVLCVVCGRTDGWYHNEAERGHSENFHAFRAAQ